MMGPCAPLLDSSRRTRRDVPIPHTPNPEATSSSTLPPLPKETQSTSTLSQLPTSKPHRVPTPSDLFLQAYLAAAKAQAIAATSQRPPMERSSPPTETDWVSIWWMHGSRAARRMNLLRPRKPVRCFRLWKSNPGDKQPQTEPMKYLWGSLERPGRKHILHRATLSAKKPCRHPSTKPQDTQLLAPLDVRPAQ